MIKLVTALCGLVCVACLVSSSTATGLNAQVDLFARIAKTFAFHNLQTVKTPQPNFAVELELNAHSQRSTKNTLQASDSLPSDSRTPTEDTNVNMQSAQLPSDATPSEMEASTDSASSEAESMRFSESRSRSRRSETSADAHFSFGGMGKRFMQQKDKMLGQNIPHLAEKYEDCMVCRYIWSQVEMDVANARYVEDVQASFEHNCLEAQKAPIFYNGCEDMYDDMYAMTDDYMSQKLTVDDMCMRAKMCDDPSKSKISLFG